jgi:catecholate siderophore receptor
MQFKRRRLPMAVLVTFAAMPLYASAEVAATEVGTAGQETLPEVAVKADKTQESRYQPLTTVTATKIEAPLRDIPQTVNVVTSALMHDQGARSIEDALRNVPGIGFSNGDGQRDQVNIRGFSAIADQFVDGVRDDALYYRDLANVEQIEVLKGPASVLYGRGSSGGIINRVTKKPVYGDSITDFTVTAGSFDMKRAEMDVNRQLGDSAAFRINAAKEDSGSFRQQGFIDRQLIAPSLSLKLSDQTNVLFQLESLEDRRVDDFGIPAINGKPADVSIKTYYGSRNASKDDYVQSRVNSGAIVLEHRFDNGWKLKDTFRAYDYDLDRNNTVATSVDATTFMVKRRHSTIQRQEHGYFNQTDLSVNADFMGLQHALLFGMELGYQHKDAQSGNFANPAAVNLFNPVLTSLNTSTLTLTGNTSATSQVAGFYVQDLVTLNQHWKALVGLRQDRFDQNTDDLLNNKKFGRVDNALSPRAGLVYQPTLWTSFYASYTNSFQPSQETFALAANNADIAPEETTNYEVGAKADWLGGDLSTMISVFRLERTNIKTTDPANSSLLVAVGEQRTDGVELSMSGRLAPGLDLTAGYAYMDGEITKSNTVTSGVALQGNKSSLTPRNSGNVWLTQRLGNGFGFGGGAVLMDSQYASPTNLVRLPGYARFDATVFYEAKSYEVRLAVNNLFDRRYFVSAHGGADLYNTPGAPRNALLTLKLKF